MSSIFIAFLQLFSVIGIGSAIEKILGIEKKSFFEQLIFGVGSIIFIEYLINYLGFLYQIKTTKEIFNWALISIGIVLFLKEYGKSIVLVFQTKFKFEKPIKFQNVGLIALGILLAIFILMLIVRSATPCREGDALTGYFFSSKWISEKGFAINPYNLKYWHFPLGIESFYSLSFNLGFPNSSKVFEVLILVAFLFQFYNKSSNVFGVIILAVIALTLPDYKQIGTGKIDIFCSSLFGYLLYKIGSGIKKEDIWIYVFLFFIMLVSKYTFWILLVIPGITILYHFRKDFIQLSIFILSCVIALTLVTVKNFISTGNPVAPFGKDHILTKNVFLEHHSDHAIFKVSNCYDYLINPESIGFTWLFFIVLALGIVATLRHIYLKEKFKLVSHLYLLH